MVLASAFPAYLRWNQTPRPGSREVAPISSLPEELKRLDNRLDTLGNLFQPYEVKLYRRWPDEPGQLISACLRWKLFSPEGWWLLFPATYENWNPHQRKGSYALISSLPMRIETHPPKPVLYRCFHFQPTMRWNKSSSMYNITGLFQPHENWNFNMVNSSTFSWIFPPEVKRRDHGLVVVPPVNFQPTYKELNLL